MLIISWSLLAMRRIILIMFAAYFCSGCSNRNNRIGNEDNILGNWQIGEYVDDFDKPTG